MFCSVGEETGCAERGPSQTPLQEGVRQLHSWVSWKGIPHLPSTRGCVRQRNERHRRRYDTSRHNRDSPLLWARWKPSRHINTALQRETTAKWEYQLLELLTAPMANSGLCFPFKGRFNAFHNH